MRSFAGSAAIAAGMMFIATTCGACRATKADGHTGFPSDGQISVDLAVTVERTGPDDAHGPLAFAPVRWFVDARPWCDTDSPWREEGSAVTDADGRARVDVPVPIDPAEFSVFALVGSRWELLASHLLYSESITTEERRRGIEVRAHVEIEPESRIEVRVASMATDEPLSGARAALVHAVDAAPVPMFAPVVTDAKGRAGFSIASIASRERSWWVDLEAAGFVPRRAWIRGASRDASSVAFVPLAPATEVRLRVVDPERSAAEGVHVIVEHPEWEGTPEFGECEWYYVTDRDGRCRVLLDRTTRVVISAHSPSNGSATLRCSAEDLIGPGAEVRLVLERALNPQTR